MALRLTALRFAFGREIEAQNFHLITKFDMKTETTINHQTPPDAKRMLGECGFSIGQKVQVFDGQKWEKTGDIGDNECMWIEATITGCSVNDYKELLIEVIMVNGRASLGYYKEGVRHFA